MTNRDQPTTYLRYSPDVEVEQPHEAEDIQALRETFAQIRSMAFDKLRHAVRDAHAKSHGVLAGSLRIHDDLPTELRQGLFAQTGEHPVIIRFSTAPRGHRLRRNRFRVRDGGQGPRRRRREGAAG